MESAWLYHHVGFSTGVAFTPGIATGFVGHNIQIGPPRLIITVKKMLPRTQSL
jgi:hypothetical protein